MFGSVLRSRALPRRRLGTGLAVAVALHAVALTAGVALSTGEPPAPRELELTFVPPSRAPATGPEQATAPAPPAPPRPARAARLRAGPAAPAPVAAPAPAPDLAPEARAPPAAAPPPHQPPAPRPSPPASRGEREGAANAPAAADAVGSIPSPGSGGVTAEEVAGAAAVAGGAPGDPGPPLEFDGRMTPPVKLSGPDPRYTPEAIAREIEGTMTVRCVVGVDGRVRECRVLRGLPYLDGAALEALQRRVYRPATLSGASIEVSYVFRISMRLP